MIAALLEARAKLWWRRTGKARLWLQFAGLLTGAAVCAGICLLVAQLAHALGTHPRALRRAGGPVAVFAGWLFIALLGRVWIALLSVAQPSRLFELRRFRIYPVRPALLSAVNFVAAFLEPTWLLVYPVLVVMAVGISRMPGGPSAFALCAASAFAVFTTGGLLFFFAAAGTALESRPLLRRAFPALLFVLGIGGVQVSSRDAVLNERLTGLFADSASLAMRFSPPGWAAQLALGKLGYAVPLAGTGLVFALLAHALASRDVRRAPEEVQASSRSVRRAGWSLPLVPSTFSAWFEKEAKTALRAGWLQLVLVPVAYVLLVKTVFAGPQPLLVAAVYAHLSVLDLATNAFGRDATAARALFLWPLSLREVLAAKNAVAYFFSLAILALLTAVTAWGGGLRPSQIVLGFVAHAATFPLLAAMGNAVSAVAPSPVRGMRLRRVRGAAPVGARLLALGVLALAVWAPYAMAMAVGLPLLPVYLGVLLAMAVVYLATLGAGAKLVQARRELLLAALSKDDEV
ncbi:MAG TPA: hypothetical protein VGH20_18655 [Myxococcales bacterium]|jgi:hypothetical protein